MQNHVNNILINSKVYQYDALSPNLRSISPQYSKHDFMNGGSTLYTSDMTSSLGRRLTYR